VRADECWGAPARTATSAPDWAVDDRRIRLTPNVAGPIWFHSRLANAWPFDESLEGANTVAVAERPRRRAIPAPKVASDVKQTWPCGNDPWWGEERIYLRAAVTI